MKNKYNIIRDKSYILKKNSLDIKNPYELLPVKLTCRMGRTTGHDIYGNKQLIRTYRGKYKDGNCYLIDGNGYFIYDITEKRFCIADINENRSYYLTHHPDVVAIIDNKKIDWANTIVTGYYPQQIFNNYINTSVPLFNKQTPMNITNYSARKSKLCINKIYGNSIDEIITDELDN